MKPDGYNYVLMALPTLILTTLNPQVDFKPEEFTPIYAWVLDQPVLYVHSDSWGSFDEFVKAGRQEPILVGITGLRSTTHLSTVVMAETLKLKIRFISYKGGGDMMAALAGKHIQAVVTLPATAMALEKAGRVRALLTLGTEKSSGSPNAPTPKSIGYDIPKTVPWLLGIVGPPKLPEPIAATFESAINKAVKDPKYQEFAKERKLDLIYMPSKQLGEEIRKAIRRYSHLWRIFERKAMRSYVLSLPTFWGDASWGRRSRGG